MLPVPTLAQLALWSGRPEASYTSYVNSASLQATLQFTIVTELTPDDYSGLNADDQALAQQGIMSMADWIYLRQPYQSVIAGPLQSETIGSYTYAKPFATAQRTTTTAELGMSSTGVVLWDLAVQMLSKRQRANGVFFGQVRAFDRESFDPLEVTMIRTNRETGDMELLGPADFDKLQLPFSVSAEIFPSDPSVG